VKLTAAMRKKIPRSDFAVPSKAPGSGSYPIEDASHARNALARSSGKPIAAEVRAKVLAKYPSMGPKGHHPKRGKMDKKAKHNRRQAIAKVRAGVNYAGGHIEREGFGSGSNGG
jgi:hypothetical protein